MRACLQSDGFWFGNAGQDERERCLNASDLAAPASLLVIFDAASDGLPAANAPFP